MKPRWPERLKWRPVASEWKAGGKEKPEVSIIIPTYNEEMYIGACLASIRRQKTRLP